MPQIREGLDHLQHLARKLGVEADVSSSKRGFSDTHGKRSCNGDTLALVSGKLARISVLFIGRVPFWPSSFRASSRTSFFFRFWTKRRIP